MPAINLTAARAVEKLIEPGWYSMLGQPSFGVRVSKAGAKSWYWQGRVDGRQVWKQLGRVGDVTLDDARALALSLGQQKAAAKVGQAKFDPVLPHEVARSPLTVAEMYAFYMERHGNGTKRPDHLRNTWRRHCQALAAERVADLDVERVQDWHDAIEAPVAALHAVQLLRSAARRCMKKPSASGWPKGHANPFSGVEVEKAKPRVRKLEGADLVKFARAADQYPDPAARVFALALHVTGARVSELRLATVQQYDRERRCIAWTDSKNGQARVLTLGTVTGKLVADLVGKRTTGFIFQGESKDGCRDFRKPWFALCKAAKVSDYTFHDARRSYAAVLTSSGFSDLTVEQLLGHKLPGAQKHYHALDIHSPARSEAAAAVEAAMGLAKRPARRTEKRQARRSR